MTIKIKNFTQKDDTLLFDIEYTPVQPVQYISITTTLYPKKMSWREVLNDMYFQCGTSRDELAQLDATFREKFPGEYTLEEFYNAKLQRFDVRLKFADPKQETMFLLKNSA